MSNDTNNTHLTGRVPRFNTVKVIITAFLVSTVANAQSETANLVDGGQIYNTYCAVFHKLGLNAAPKYGNKILWGKVVKSGSGNSLPACPQRTAYHAAARRTD